MASSLLFGNEVRNAGLHIHEAKGASSSKTTLIATRTSGHTAVQGRQGLTVLVHHLPVPGVAAAAIGWWLPLASRVVIVVGSVSGRRDLGVVRGRTVAIVVRVVVAVWPPGGAGATRREGRESLDGPFFLGHFDWGGVAGDAVVVAAAVAVLVVGGDGGGADGEFIKGGVVLRVSRRPVTVFVGWLGFGGGGGVDRVVRVQRHC